MANAPKFNIHTHTYRCGHATGTDREYVEAAYQNGVRYLGFSDHVFIPGRSDPHMRGDYSLLDDYLLSIRGLADEFKDKMTIKVGFEAEWYHQEYEAYYRDLLKSGKIDYLILGQHCCILNNRFFGYGYMADDDQLLDRYANDLIAGMESGLFTYVCHPDLFLLFIGNWTAKCIEITHRICKAAKSLQIPLEINMGASRHKGKNRPGEPLIPVYPYPKFWEIVKQYDIPVIIGVDAHSPDEFASSDYRWVRAFIRWMGLRLLDEVELCNPYAPK